MMKPDVTIPIILLTKRAAVYAWRRGSEYLYIGQSLSCINRLRKHHALKEKLFQPEDVIDVWFCDPGERLKFEAKMLLKYKPRYNVKFPSAREPKRQFDSFKDSFEVRKPSRPEQDARVAEYLAKYGPLVR